ncbi:uncharacterized protein LOC130361197 isoform X2 [Hyla sarda]|uniref:uncharacterized protein LOC130361197 isoform X2 n=1 Tax=Hyla sarda TaxID=327740 RepID=UPI0024C212EF|nr:uncharacterized protein LOC130361197 isoform X2 [Hyla sarda]
MKVVKEVEAPSVNAFNWNLPQPGATVKVYASAVDGPECFWCQLSTADMDSLASQVQEAGEKSVRSNDFIASLRVGSPCNVIFSEDNNWYRAMVTKMESDVVTVRFTDYGNEDSVGQDQIRQLPEPLVKISPQAFSCCLADFDMKAETWTSEGRNYFYEKVNEDMLELTIHEIQEPDESYIPVARVTIKCNGLDIREDVRQFLQGVKSEGLEVPDGSINLTPIDENQAVETDQPQVCEELCTTDVRAYEPEESALEGQYDEDCPLQEDVIEDQACSRLNEEQESDTDGVKEAVNLHHKAHNGPAVEDLSHVALKDQVPQDEFEATEEIKIAIVPGVSEDVPEFEEFEDCTEGPYEENNDPTDDVSSNHLEQGGLIESGRPETAAHQQCPDLMSSRHQEHLSRDTSASVESLISHFNDKLFLLNEERTTHDAAKKEVTTDSEEAIVPEAESAEEFEDCTEDGTKKEKEENEGVDVPSGDYVEIEDALRSESLETSHFAESDDLHKAEEPLPNKMSQEDKIIATIKVADEIVPSVISEDVHKIENIVKNEDVAANDSMLAIEGNKVYNEAMASEDVLDDDTVDNVVSVELLYIEPEKDEANKDVEKYGGLVISEDDLVPGDAKMLLESKAVTEGEEVSEDCMDIEEICAEDLSLKEETVTEVTTESEEAIVPEAESAEEFEDCTEDGTKQEKEENEGVDVPSGDYVEIEDALRSESLETSHFAESDDLHKAEEPLPNKMSQEGKIIATIKFADEIVPSVISEDVHKIENIVKNEDVSATDSMLVIEGNKVYDEAMASEDVLDDDTVDNVVSVELLYIEPEKDEANKDVEKYGGLVISEDDLVPGDAKMLLESKAVTEGEEVSEDCMDIEEICAENLSLKEETVTDETKREKVEHEGVDVPGEEYLDIENALGSEAIETILESDDLHKNGGPAHSIMSQEDKKILTIKVADEIVPSVINEDVQKIENIVKNEAVEATDAILAIEGNKVYDKAMAREDVLDDDTVENVVSAELLYIEPEKDEANKKVEKYGGLVINEDDLVPGDAKMLLESKAVTEGEDCMDIEAICAEDLSLKEETVTDGTNQEKVEHVDVPSEDYVEIENALRSEALETSLEFDYLHKDGGPAPSIMSQEDKNILTIKVADEDVEATDSILAIEGNKVYDEAMASEDVLDDDTVENVVSAELLCIEPDKDEAIKDVGHYGGLVFSEDDLLPDDVKMLLVSKAVTEGEEVSEDCMDIEAICAEDLSLKEETITGKEAIEHVRTITSNDFIQSDLTSCDFTECAEVTTTHIDLRYIEEEIQEDEEVATLEGAVGGASLCFHKFEAILVKGPWIDLTQKCVAFAEEKPVDDKHTDLMNLNQPVADGDLETRNKELKENMKLEKNVDTKDKELKDSVNCGQSVTDDLDLKDSKYLEELVVGEVLEVKDNMSHEESIEGQEKDSMNHDGAVTNDNKELKYSMKSEEGVACEDVNKALASEEVFCGFLSADFIDLKEPEIIQGFVETVKADTSQHVEDLGTVTSNDFVESKGDLTESNITECGAGTTTDIAEIINKDEELVSTERAIREISLSFEEVKATVVEGPFVDLCQEFVAGVGEEPVENKDLEFKDTMTSEEVLVEEDLEIGASAFEENFWESLCTGDISDNELVEDFSENSQHSVDCVRGECDPSEDTLPADDSSTTLPEEQGSQSGSFTSYRESPTLIASTESELSDPLEETDSDSEAPEAQDSVETKLSPYVGRKKTSQAP